MTYRTLLQDLLTTALQAVAAEHCVPPFLPAVPAGRTLVIGAGKAAAAMAQVVETHWPTPIHGSVVTRYGYGVPCRQIEVLEAGHPLSDAESLHAASRILSCVHGLTADDRVICLLSGGGSALLEQPAAGLTLADQQAVNRALLTCGAAIAEINCVRKHLSAIKGGRLALACWPAPVTTLAVSDVPGDDPAVIASGPTVADPTTCQQALAIVAHYGVVLPPAVRAHLQSPHAETPKPTDPRLAHNTYHVIARGQQALTAVAQAVAQQGFTPLNLGDALEGEARDVAKVMAGLVRSCRRDGQPVRPPCALISGGETTVTVRGKGRGGRNSEFLLALAVALGEDGVYALAADTDGLDGTQDNAGALLTPDSLARARVHGLDPHRCLYQNDSYHYFATLNDLLITGPTRTNVNDLRIILIS